MNFKQQLLVRKTHRYLGLFIGIQFILWTAGGLYFSWTNIDKIHGDHFRNMELTPTTIPLNLLTNLPESTPDIQSVESLMINDDPHFWINEKLLINAQTGQAKERITKEEAKAIASKHILPKYQVKSVTYLTEVGAHHEYRNRPLPVWEINYQGSHHMKAYVDAKSGRFQRVRYDSWRIFDFLWMLHVMDYDSRDDINNWILRIFSLLGICSILSGFLLFIVSSRSIRKIKKRGI